MKRNRTKLQDSVISLARRMLKKRRWYRGVCLDMLKELTDARIRKIGRHQAAKEIYMDTAFWDGDWNWRNPIEPEEDYEEEAA